MTIAFVLVSWRPDIPAGMERAVAAIAAAWVDHGGKALIITADAAAPSTYRNVQVITLQALDVRFPCDDVTLRSAIDASAASVCGELATAYGRHRVRAAVYVDALWGLGRIMPTCPAVRNLLAAHVVGHDEDLHAALSLKPAAVIAPSDTVLRQATARGYATHQWTIVPNTLLTVPVPPPPHDRERVRIAGPVRVLARLGPEKGVVELLESTAHLDRAVEVALAEAPFEAADGSQVRLRERCRSRADETPYMTLRPGLRWDEVPGWLGDASLVIVPSHAETFGLVALEAMAAGTPVVAHDVGNLPHLIGDAGDVVPRQSGAPGLWRAARNLLADPVRYGAASRAAYYRSRDYWPALVANQLSKVVS